MSYIIKMAESWVDILDFDKSMAVGIAMSPISNSPWVIPVQNGGTGVANSTSGSNSLVVNSIATNTTVAAANGSPMFLPNYSNGVLYFNSGSTNTNITLPQVYTPNARLLIINDTQAIISVYLQGGSYFFSLGALGNAELMYNGLPVTEGQAWDILSVQKSLYRNSAVSQVGFNLLSLPQPASSSFLSLTAVPSGSTWNMDNSWPTSVQVWTPSTSTGNHNIYLPNPATISPGQVYTFYCQPGGNAVYLYTYANHNQVIEFFGSGTIPAQVGRLTYVGVNPRTSSNYWFWEYSGYSITIGTYAEAAYIAD
jgi:hypothetical protein